MTIPEITAPRARALLFAAALSAAFWAMGLLLIQAADDPSIMDTGVYLSCALGISESGGIGSFLWQSYTGQWPDAEQNPLYHLILSLFARRDIQYFPEAKLATLASGWLTLLTLFFLVRKRAGETVAVVATLLLLFNANFLRLSTVVTVEPFLLLWILLTWYCVVEGFERPRLWGLAGIFAGLAFLSKGPGLFLIPSSAGAICLGTRFRALRSKHFWLFFLCLFLAGSPLFVRNLIVYGSPTYNFNNNSLWADEWDPDAIRESPVSFSQYIDTHSWADVAARIELGTYEQAVNLHRMLNYNILPFDPSAVLNDMQPRTALSLLLALLALTGAILHWRDHKSLLWVALHMGIFYSLFSWTHQILGDPRFLLPIVPFVYLYAAVPLAGMTQPVEQRLPGTTTLLLATALICFTGYLGFARSYANPLHAYREDDNQAELLAFLESSVQPGDTYLFDTLVYDAEGYSGSARYEFQWYAQIQGETLSELPELPTAGDFLHYLDREQVDWLVLARHNLEQRPSLLGTWLDWRGAQGLVLRAPLPGWRLAASDPRPPVSWLCFERTTRVERRRRPDGV